jgi:hypothetical protein
MNLPELKVGIITLKRGVFCPSGIIAMDWSVDSLAMSDVGSQ